MENKGLREWKHKQKPQADEDHRQAFYCLAKVGISSNLIPEPLINNNNNNNK